MNIQGLQYDYYLAGNDIWVKVSDAQTQNAPLQVKITLGEKELSLNIKPNPNGEYRFNIAVPIRAMFPEPNPIDPNTLQKFSLVFSINDKEKTLTKHFIRGGREGNAPLYLSEGAALVVGKWLTFDRFAIGVLPRRIQGSELMEFYPANEDMKQINIRNNCDVKVLKFLNSLGGYQYFVFEYFETKTQAKPTKTIGKITENFFDHGFINLGNTTEKTIELRTKTPADIQEVFEDLVKSQDVYLVDFNARSGGQYQRLILEQNESLFNNYEQIFENKITFSFATKTTKWI